EATLQPVETPSAASVAVPGNVRVGEAPAAAVRPTATASASATGAPSPSPAASFSAVAPGANGDAPSALQRAMAAIRGGKPGADATEALGRTPRPAPTAKVSSLGGLTASSMAESSDVEALRARVADLERRLAESLTRERDLVELIGRWQEREINR